MINFLKKKLNLIDGIYNFEIKDASVKKVTDFYKDSPFPNYKVSDNKYTIKQKGDNNLLASQFKKFTGYKKNILEVGCGTGQLSIYFSIGSNNNIVGLDPTIESLRIAKNFASKNFIKNINFLNVDIFDDVLTENYFDFIWCNGVLHHTKNPLKGFDIISKSLKSNGYILVGLYNKYGRVRTIIRRFFYKIFGEIFVTILDPTLRNLKDNSEERKAWIRDQYIHPIESLHTLDEVLLWFERNNIDFINSIPSCNLDYDYQNLFEKTSKGSFFSRMFNQFLMIFNKLGSDGGLFVVIGKKLK